MNSKVTLHFYAKSTKANGNGAPYQRCPGVMQFNDAFSLRNSIQNPRNTMTDIVFYNKSNKKRGDKNTNSRKNKIPIVYFAPAKVFGK